MSPTPFSPLAPWSWQPIDWVNHLWQSSVVALALLILIALCSRLSARTRRTLGWMALAKFVLPLALFAQALSLFGVAPERWLESRAFTVPAAMSAAFGGDRPEATGALGFSSQDVPGIGAFSDSSAASVGITASGPRTRGLSFNISARTAIWGFWFAGFGALFFSWAVRGTQVRRRILSTASPLSPEMGAVLSCAVRRGGFRMPRRCFEVACGDGPGVLGVFSPVLIVPRGIEETLTKSELESVLIHELIHLQRRDNLLSVLQAFAVSALWFNPVAWLVGRRLAVETEKSCDERVVEITNDPATYAGSIVKAARLSLGLPGSVLLGIATPPVVARIDNILSRGSHRDRPLARCAAIAAGALLLALGGHMGSIAIAAPAPVAPQIVQPTESVAKSPSVVSLAPPRQPDSTDNHPITVSFPDEDIRTILHNVARLFDLNILMPDALQGRTSIKLQDVTWRQVFGVVLEPIGYTFVEQDGVVKIVAKTSLEQQPGSSAKAEAFDLLEALQRGRPPLAAGVGPTFTADQFPLVINALNELSQSKATAPATVAKILTDDGRITAVAPNTAVSGTSAVIGTRTKDDFGRDTLTVSFPQEDIRTILNNVADLFDLNIVIPETLHGKTSANLQNVTWRQIFETVLSPVGYTFVVEGNIVKVIQATAANTGWGSKPDIVPPDFPDHGPVPVAQPLPAYPDDLAKKGISGTVVVGFTVDLTSEVRNVRIISSTQREFEAAALKAVQTWKYEAARKAGRAVAAMMEQEITFANGNIVSISSDVEPQKDAAAGSASTRIYDIKELDQEPQATYRRSPVYPDAMKKVGITATVVIGFQVDTAGAPQNVRVVSSTNREFEDSALKAVSGWRFKPGRKDGKAVMTSMQAPIVFQISNFR